MGILEEMRDLLKSIDSKIPGNGPKPPISGWPNEPKNFVPIADWALSESPDALVDGDFPIGDQGFRIIYNTEPGTLFGPETGPPYEGTPRGYSLAGNDTSAPYSPPHVIDLVYPKGMRLGTAPSTIYKQWSSAQQWGYREIYCAWYCKHSDPFDFCPAGSKMTFLFNGGGGVGGQAILGVSPDHYVWMMPEYPDPPPDSPLYRVRRPNQPGAKPITLNEYHLYEWYMRIPETNDPSVSLVRWWLDGVLQGEYNDVWNAFPMDMFQISSTYGGNGDMYKPQDDHIWYDHVYISIPKQEAR